LADAFHDLKRFRLTLALTVVALVALVAPGWAVAAGHGTIAGKLRGIGESTGSEQFVTVRAIQADTGEAIASQRLTDSLKYKLKVPAGFYVLFADASGVGTGTALAAHGHVIKLKSGRRAHEDLRLKKKRASRMRATAGVASQPIAKRAKGVVLAVSPDVRVFGDPENPKGIPVWWMLITELANGACPPEQHKPLMVVAHRKSSDFKAIQAEIKLQNSGHVDPSTQVKPRFIKPQVEVTGGGQISGGTLSMQFNLVNLKTGKVIGSVSASGPAASFFEVYDALARKLIDEICKDEQPPDKFTGTFSGTNATAANDRWDGTVAFDYSRTDSTSQGQIARYTPTGGSVTWQEDPYSQNGCNFSPHSPVTAPINAGSGELLLYLDRDPMQYGLTVGNSSGYPSMTVDYVCPPDPNQRTATTAPPCCAWTHTYGTTPFIVGDGFALAGTADNGPQHWQWSLTPGS